MKKILILSLALVLALGSLGVAGALWWDDLYIGGVVNTGDIGAEWSIQDYYDNEAENKDVSEVAAVLSADRKTMLVIITNAYPCITYTVDWDIHCTGSVPIHFDEPYIETNLPAGATFTFTDMGGVPINWSGVQLHQGDILLGKLTIHLDNDAEQLWFYDFYIELMYYQYNESP